MQKIQRNLEIEVVTYAEINALTIALLLPCDSYDFLSMVYYNFIKDLTFGTFKVYFFHLLSSPNSSYSLKIKGRTFACKGFSIWSNKLICKCGAVEFPELPTFPIKSPDFKSCSSFTFIEPFFK